MLVGGYNDNMKQILKCWVHKGYMDQLLETNYRPVLTFDSGYHHIQSDYNLDLDKADGIIYSGSRKIFGTDVGNVRVNDYNLNVNMDNNYRSSLTFDSGYHHIQSDYSFDLDEVHGTTYSGSGIMFGTDIGNARVNDYNLNVNLDNQYFGEPNMSDPRNIIVTSYEGDIVGSDSNEKENCDTYFNLNNMINLFQNLDPPSANLPNEQSSEFSQVCSDDQIISSRILDLHIYVDRGSEFGECDDPVNASF
ncbi:hypothetical protein HAX54_024311 [Datura stramonium]|uniref:Uncharacterized protein n=1 Tax=Datura stramonium TaxID=4076 RepID=A0ABS8UYJ8_DATST|nr:hypothetical protein [Datura stramonium]